MDHTLLRKAQALLLGCVLLAACSKSATVNEMSETRKTEQRARVGEDSKSPLPPAPMPIDSLELAETHNPQDI
jgi:hypothetical protein